jgi:hypothetical protein
MKLHFMTDTIHLTIFEIITKKVILYAVSFRSLRAFELTKFHTVATGTDLSPHLDLRTHCARPLVGPRLFSLSAGQVRKFCKPEVTISELLRYAHLS